MTAMTRTSSRQRYRPTSRFVNSTCRVVPARCGGERGTHCRVVVSAHPAGANRPPGSAPAATVATPVTARTARPAAPASPSANPVGARSKINRRSSVLRPKFSCAGRAPVHVAIATIDARRPGLGARARRPARCSMPRPDRPPRSTRSVSPAHTARRPATVTVTGSALRRRRRRTGDPAGIARPSTRAGTTLASGADRCDRPLRAERSRCASRASSGWSTPPCPAAPTAVSPAGHRPGCGRSRQRARARVASRPSSAAPAGR